MRVKPWIAALGAIAFTFSSYNFIYIEAGHASKAYAIAFFAPVIAGVFLTLRGKYLWGAEHAEPDCGTGCECGVELEVAL